MESKAIIRRRRKCCEAYSPRTYYLLNNFTLWIKDKEI